MKRKGANKQGFYWSQRSHFLLVAGKQTPGGLTSAALTPTLIS